MQGMFIKKGKQLYERRKEFLLVLISQGTETLGANRLNYC